MVPRHRWRYGPGAQCRERNERLHADRPRHLAQLQQQGIARDRRRRRPAPDQSLRRHRTRSAKTRRRKAWASEDLCGLAGVAGGTTGDRRISGERGEIVQSVGGEAEVSESCNPGRASDACRGTRLRAPVLLTQPSLRHPCYATLGVRLRELRWKNSAWLATADTMAGWNGFEIRNAGSGRSPVRKRSGYAVMNTTGTSKVRRSSLTASRPEEPSAS